MPSAVVFAYHNVGVRCLKVLLAHGVDVPLVITHEDSPGEVIWFDSVARTAADYGLPTLLPADPNTADVVGRVAKLRPDFIFSFYYRSLLRPPLLELAQRGALNMHGSLLPRYRGRVPVNWAIIHGEKETGATLHYMTEKADAGDIVARTGVPILNDDTAVEVFGKVTLAAELTLDRILPALIAGIAPRTAQDDGKSSYFGARKPEDGVIDWSRCAADVHNLVRAVAPPYPGARTTIGGRPARVLRTRVLEEHGGAQSSIGIEQDRLVARCSGGGRLAVLQLEIDGRDTDARSFAARFGDSILLDGKADHPK